MVLLTELKNDPKLRSWATMIRDNKITNILEFMLQQDLCYSTKYHAGPFRFTPGEIHEVLNENDEILILKQEEPIVKRDVNKFIHMIKQMKIDNCIITENDKITIPTFYKDNNHESSGPMYISYALSLKQLLNNDIISVERYDPLQEMSILLNKINVSSVDSTYVFISYSDKDIRKVEILRDLLNQTKEYKPLIIADNKEPLKTLVSKVSKGIKDSKIFIPILTNRSIKEQWINQEIGYAYSYNDNSELNNAIYIIPIIEKDILKEIKGFIHKEVDLPFSFEAHPSHMGIENKNFKRSASQLITHLTSKVSEIK
jgi:hypothetical protein